MRPCHHWPNWIHTRGITLGIATAVLFLMPVTYRGGSDAEHPHALLQLLHEASLSMPDHHHSYLPHADTASDAHGTAEHVAPDIPRTQESAFAIGVVPVPMLPPSPIPVPETTRVTDRFAREGVTLTGILHSPDPPPPKMVSGT